MLAHHRLFTAFIIILFIGLACTDDKTTTAEQSTNDSSDEMTEFDMSEDMFKINAMNNPIDMQVTPVDMRITQIDMTTPNDFQMLYDSSIDDESMPPPVASTCPVSCDGFAVCAITQCPGYDEPDRELLIEGCMEVCTPALAGIFDSLDQCEDKLKFVGGIERSFQNFCDSATDGFCETYLAVCDTWPNDAVACEDLYQTSMREGVNPTSGAHQVCYEYHLGAAMVAEREGHVESVRNYCLIAAGFAPCIE